jgi:hypothetical protein
MPSRRISLLVAWIEENVENPNGFQVSQESINLYSSQFHWVSKLKLEIKKEFEARRPFVRDKAVGDRDTSTGRSGCMLPPETAQWLRRAHRSL